MSRDTQNNDKRLKAAAEWMLRLDDATVSSEDITAWLAWCEADPLNRESFDRVQATWDLCPGLDVTELMRADTPLWRRALVAARRWVDDNGRMLGAAMTAAAVTAAAFIVVPQLLDGSTAPETQQARQAPPAPIRETRLADGSAMQLATGSRVSIKFTPSTRLLELTSGEAFFKVAKAKDRPFVVAAGSVRVTAVGTAFNVRRAADRVVVTVTEGLVDVSRDSIGEIVQIAAGSQLIWDAVEPGPTLISVQPEQAVRWQQGVLAYRNEPLAAVIADFNRYADRPVRIDDPSIRDLQFTGTLFTLDTRDWLYALPLTLPVELRNEGDVWVITARSGKAG